MLITAIINNLSIFRRHKKYIKYILFIVSSYLLIPSPTQNKLMSYESCFDVLNDKDFLLPKPKKFIYKMPSETILIITNEKEYYENKINKLKIRTKYIKVSSVDLKGNFFLKIYLKNSHSTFVDVNYWGFMPISEIFFLLSVLFNIRYDFNPLNTDNSWNNQVVLSLSKIDTNAFLYFLRVCSNFHSHYYGYYFYFPLSNSIIKGEKIALFNASMSFLHLFFLEDFNIHPFKIITMLILSIINPFTFILFLNTNYRFYYSILLSISDLKFGFYYNFIIYFYYAFLIVHKKI